MVWKCKAEFADHWQLQNVVTLAKALNHLYNGHSEMYCKIRGWMYACNSVKQLIFISWVRRCLELFTVVCILDSCLTFIKIEHFIGWTDMIVSYNKFHILQTYRVVDFEIITYVKLGGILFAVQFCHKNKTKENNLFILFTSGQRIIGSSLSHRPATFGSKKILHIIFKKLQLLKVKNYFNNEYCFNFEKFH